jgi:hypothetical protein
MRNFTLWHHPSPQTHIAKKEGTRLPGKKINYENKKEQMWP